MALMLRETVNQSPEENSQMGGSTMPNHAQMSNALVPYDAEKQATNLQEQEINE